MPALRAAIDHRDLPEQVGKIEESGIEHVHRIDATPIGVNIRSTRAGATVPRPTPSCATVIVIEHDLDMIANPDWVIDIGPGGGESGGRVVATGTPGHVARSDDSTTGAYLRPYLGS